MPDEVRDECVEDLTRIVPFVVRDATANGDGLTIDGYGAVFNAETTIDSWEGKFREQIAPGSFRKSLREQTPRMQFDHGRHPLIGSIPIGAFNEGFPREEEQGLRVLGRLLDNWLVQPVRDAIANHSIDGMSFRFTIVREMWQDAQGRKITDPRTIREFIWRPPEDGLLLRTVQEVKLSEVGPVVWPAYDQTSVGVREGTIDLARLHEPEVRNRLARAILIADSHEGRHDVREPSTTSRTGTPGDTHGTTGQRSNAPSTTSRHGTPGDTREVSDHQQQEPAGFRASLDRWRTAKQSILDRI